MGLRGGYHRITLEGEEIVVEVEIILVIENIALANEDKLINPWQIMKELKTGDSLRFKILRKGKFMKFLAAIT